MKRLLVVLAVVASACGADSGGGATVPDDSAPLATTTTSTTIAPTTTTTTTLAEVSDSVSITGTALPRFGDSPDQAVGLTAPEVVGTSFDGSEVRIERSGNYTVLIILAHWCPFCRDEIENLGPYFAETPLPAGVEVVTVSTSVRETESNYPPSKWLIPEAWSLPVLADTAESEVGNAFGLRSLPYWVILDPDGVVLARTAGSLPLETVEGLLANLAELAQS